MRTKAEIRLLMVRQNIKDAMNRLLKAEVIDLNKYRILQAKFNVTQSFIIQLRKKSLKIKKSAI